MIFLITSLTNWNTNPYQIHIPVNQEESVTALLVQHTTLPYNYIEQRFMIAIALEEQTGVPFNVQVAIDIIESGVEKNKEKFNNSSWITCRCNFDDKLRKQHETEDVCFYQFDTSMGKTYYFKKYKNIQENWAHKAYIISNYSWFKKDMPFDWYAERLEGSFAESVDYKEGLMRVYNSYLKDMKYDILYF